MVCKWPSASADGAPQELGACLMQYRGLIRLYVSVGDVLPGLGRGSSGASPYLFSILLAF